jgi:hypothetical protein
VASPIDIDPERNGTWKRVRVRLVEWPGNLKNGLQYSFGRLSGPHARLQLRPRLAEQIPLVLRVLSMQFAIIRSAKLLRPFERMVDLQEPHDTIVGKSLATTLLVRILVS